MSLFSFLIFLVLAEIWLLSVVIFSWLTTISSLTASILLSKVFWYCFVLAILLLFFSNSFSYCSDFCFNSACLCSSSEIESWATTVLGCTFAPIANVPPTTVKAKIAEIISFFIAMLLSEIHSITNQG